MDNGGDPVTFSTLMYPASLLIGHIITFCMLMYSVPLLIGDLVAPARRHSIDGSTRAMGDETVKYCL